MNFISAILQKLMIRNVVDDAPRSVKDDAHKSPTPAEEDEETMSNYDKLLITDCLNHLYTRMKFYAES